MKDLGRDKRPGNESFQYCRERSFFAISVIMEDLDAILSFLPLRLKNARRAKGLSLDAVAKLSGVSRSMVSQIERGESSPTISTRTSNRTRPDASEASMSNVTFVIPSGSIETV